MLLAAGEGNGPDAPGTRFFEGACGGAEGGTCGHDIVNEENGAAFDPAGIRDSEGSGNIFVARGEGEAGLGAGIAGADEGLGYNGAVEVVAKVGGEEFGLVVAAAAGACSVEGDGEDEVDGGVVELREEGAVEEFGEIGSQPEGVAVFEHVGEVA